MIKPLIYRASNENEALRQGEILTGVIQYKPIPDESLSVLETTKFQPLVHPYTIILTQDCDLDWDYNASKNKNQPSKLLNSILLCEVFTAQEIRNDKTRSINSKDWDLVKSNRHQQYHFFEKVPSECESNLAGLPELTADFKRIFAVDTGFLYYLVNKNIAKRLTVLESPYLEHFSHHYHTFHGRVALPAQHESEKGG